MKKRIVARMFCIITCVLLLGCGQTDSDSRQEDSTEREIAAVQDEIETPEADAADGGGEAADEQDNALSDIQETDDKADEEKAVPDFMPGYATFDDWRARHMGSVGLISDRTLLVSIYLNEPDYRWEEDDIDYTRQLMDIGYGYLKEQMLAYDVYTDLIFDSKKNEDLFYELDIEENIPVYVTTEQERELDVKVDEWITDIPVQELMLKYEADSIGFLFFIAHEGCSYSSMHFIDDGIDTWDECCMLYLRDMYSDTLEYETPAVYAHELLHLFGAEDLYKAAEVFTPETYAYANRQYPEDIMIYTFQKINGKTVNYSDRVVKEISPITAYLIGVGPDDVVRENCPELLKDETGCFSGSTYDRPF